MKYMKNASSLRHLCIILGALLVGAQAHAAGFRMGFVKFDRIIKESEPAKLIQTRLEQEFSAREKDIAAQDAAFKAAADKFQIDGPVIPEAQRLSTQKTLADQERELQRKHRAFQEDLNLRKNEELQKLLASVNQVVKQVAEAENVDLVVQDAVYVNPKDDLTDKVLGALKARSK
jgi:outer membrane protein